MSWDPALHHLDHHNPFWPHLGTLTHSHTKVSFSPGRSPGPSTFPNLASQPRFPSMPSPGTQPHKSHVWAFTGVMASRAERWWTRPGGHVLLLHPPSRSSHHQPIQPGGPLPVVVTRGDFDRCIFKKWNCTELKIDGNKLFFVLLLLFYFYMKLCPSILLYYHFILFFNF